MTENEAKQVLDNIWDFVTPEDDCLGDFVENALYVVDSIFEEIQQYRAIGTVEQLEWCKDASHWKELFKEKLEKYEAIGTVEDIQEVMALCKSLQETTCKYMDIGTIEEFQALKEKSEPKKPIIHGLGQRYCPVCKCGGADHFYCARCGQKLG